MKKGSVKVNFWEFQFLKIPSRLARKIPGKIPVCSWTPASVGGFDRQFRCVDGIRGTLVGNQSQEKGIHSRFRCVDRVNVNLRV